MEQIKKVLVANRGEIAARIFRTLDKMGIDTVAVYSSADWDSNHVFLAKEACLLEGETLQETYLDIGQIIRLALHVNADAIHPGYGFLSESAGFSRAVRAAGMIFIGPGDDAIQFMGNKVEARKLAGSLNVPVAKGVTGHPETLMQLADSIGFPLLVKAAAGGGGKGMRIVHSPGELPDVLETTQREANSYFGNGEVYIEKYLEDPKHIEVQLIADSFGKTVCLFERECSIQRRYQKIVEEAPSPSVSPALRERLMDAAKRIAMKIGYINAGTIEFLVKDDEFFFLEMNTRIQVEHPVTEMITGIDIVMEQINVARGLPLSFDQDELKIYGHAIEARVYAEDPENDFMPSPGKVVFYKEPTLKGVRIDSSLAGPGEINRQFDPMISKVIAHGANRKEAIYNLKNAMMAYAVHGVKTNIHYLIGLLDADEFVAGNTNTGFCRQFFYQGSADLIKNQQIQLLLASAYIFIGNCQAGNIQNASAVAANSREVCTRKSSLWNETGYWRLSMEPVVLIDGKEFRVHMQVRNNGRLVFEDKERQTTVEMLSASNGLLLLKESNGTHSLFYSSHKKGFINVQIDGRVYSVGFAMQLDEDEINRKSHYTTVEGTGSVNAPMHGKIIKVNVKVNDVVNKGDTLLILESMKIENKILAPGKARITFIAVKTGDVVSTDTPLVMFSDEF